MKRSLELAEKLIHQSYLEKEEYMELLGSYQDKETVVCLGQEAARLREKYYGNKVYMRGLIEFTNFCKNNCYYCGIRRDNKNASRYRLTEEEILDCCKNGYELGFRTFVLQGGEDPYYTDERICTITKEIKKQMKRLWISLRRSVTVIQTVPSLFPLEKKPRKATAFTKKQEQTGICCVMKLQMKTITAIYIRNR